LWNRTRRFFNRTLKTFKNKWSKKNRTASVETSGADENVPAPRIRDQLKDAKNRFVGKIREIAQKLREKFRRKQKTAPVEPVAETSAPVDIAEVVKKYQTGAKNLGSKIRTAWKNTVNRVYRPQVAQI